MNDIGKPTTPKINVELLEKVAKNPKEEQMGEDPSQTHFLTSDKILLGKRSEADLEQEPAVFREKTKIRKMLKIEERSREKTRWRLSNPNWYFEEQRAREVQRLAKRLNQIKKTQTQLKRSVSPASRPQSCESYLKASSVMDSLDTASTVLPTPRPTRAQSPHQACRSLKKKSSPAPFSEAAQLELTKLILKRVDWSRLDALKNRPLQRMIKKRGSQEVLDKVRELGKMTGVSLIGMPKIGCETKPNQISQEDQCISSLKDPSIDSTAPSLASCLPSLVESRPFLPPSVSQSIPACPSPPEPLSPPPSVPFLEEILEGEEEWGAPPSFLFDIF